ncbi:SpoIIE family protein phosphatase [Actinomadura nitritigenes]|nr:SpoIIE family protein phosphatase [Actinomadura nitritigenes]
MSKRGRNWGQLLGEYAEVCELAQVLRDIADERQVTIRYLAQQMPYGHTKISQSLNGAKRPEWAFVDVFLRVCTAGDRQAHLVLQQKVRPLWEAAAPERARPLAEVAVASREQSIAVVPPAVQPWVSSLHDAASAQLVATQIKTWVRKHETLADGLQHMLGQIRLAITELTTRREELYEEVRTAVSEELSATRTQLADTQQRLQAALHLQASTAQRLEQVLRQRQEGLQLLQDALLQAERAEKRLADLEQRATLTSPRSEPGPDDGSTQLMGEVDQAVAAQLLHHADEVLVEGAHTFEVLRNEVKDTSPAQTTAPALSADNTSASTDNNDMAFRREHRYRTLAEAGGHIVWVADPNGDMVEDAPDWRAITGQSREDYLQHGWIAAVHPDDRRDLTVLWLDSVSNKTSLNTSFRVQTKSGSFRHFELTATPTLIEDTVIEWVGANTDVTGQREAEEMRGRLTEQLSAAALRTARLQQATSMLAEALTVSQVAQVITEAARSTIGADYSAVALLDDSKRYLLPIEPPTIDSPPGEGLTQPHPPASSRDLSVNDHTVMSTAVRQMRPFVAESPNSLRDQLGSAESEPFVQNIEEEQAWIGLPLLAAGAPIGALRFSFIRPRKINDVELVFLEALAGQCALAVERALLFEREHRTAEALQRSLLPSDLPQLPGMVLAARYNPATRHIQVGGDWYDAFRLPDERLAIAVGDVMGKGVLAVAGMGRVRNALRALALNDPEPAAVLAGLDRLFTATEDDEQFTTLAYAVIDPKTGRGEISNAGYPPPLLLAANSPARISAREPGTPLGWPALRTKIQFIIEPGHTIVFYSDGLVENRRRGMDTGLGELAAVAADTPPDLVEDPERMLDYLADRMLAGYEQTDDVTMLAVHVPPARLDPHGVAAN